jgi:hypothetical protein
MTAMLALALALGGCSSGTSPATERYYDPSGLFSAHLPADYDVLVMPAQRVQGAPALLSGVLSLPPQPDPSATSQPFGGGLAQSTTQQQDTAIYGIFVVKKTDDMKTDVDLARALLSSTIGPKVAEQDRLRIGRLQGLLAVVDHHDDTSGGGDYTDASAFVLDGDLGFWIRELFGTGEWSQRREAFLRVVHSFQPGVPAGLPAVPIARPGLQVESSISWPLG